tara:strand:- start:56 stop:406 length:351 start_codon:yes stop_codon:yes gene_type:complete
MPKIPDGELNLTQLKRLVKQYNLKMSVDTKGMKRDQLITEITKLGYKIDHANKKLDHINKGKKMKRKPEAVKLPPAPAKKTEADKTATKTKERERIIKYIIKNKDILNEDRVKALL